MIPDQPTSGNKSVTLCTLLNIAADLEKSDAITYEEILERYKSAIKPTDVFKEKWTLDLTDSSWEKYKLLSRKEQLIKTEMYDALADVLRPFVDEGSLSFLSGSQNLVCRYYRGDAEAKQYVDDLLAKTGMTMKSVEARAYAKNIEAMVYFDQAIASAEARWNSTKRELDRHCDRSRNEIPAEDAYFEVIPNESHGVKDGQPAQITG
jgi:hypothetical protein